MAVRWDCLGDVAEGWLVAPHPGAAVSDAEIARAAHAWWQANTAVLGDDPVALLHGQVLRPPG